jgi:hypothetical protein
VVLDVPPSQRIRAQRVLADIRRQMFEEAESWRVFDVAFKNAAAKIICAREIRRKADQGAGVISFDSFLCQQRKKYLKMKKLRTTCPICIY